MFTLRQHIFPNSLPLLDIYLFIPVSSVYTILQKHVYIHTIKIKRDY